jgi:hypothetical protein
MTQKAMKGGRVQTSLQEEGEIQEAAMRRRTRTRTRTETAQVMDSDQLKGSKANSERAHKEDTVLNDHDDKDSVDEEAAGHEADDDQDDYDADEAASEDDHLDEGQEVEKKEEHIGKTKLASAMLRILSKPVGEGNTRAKVNVY